MRHAPWIAALALAAFAAGCQPAPPPASRPLVVASFDPLYEFARQVAGAFFAGAWTRR
jgi:ABC-type Zn uptake system ZnuABC Zn-binding protein ZnuA